jgi:catechol 2,3-dioxygenase-like lactoylglutathione lyase family enzyme
MNVEFGVPVQIAYAVHDLGLAMERWTARGAGPFVVREHIAVHSVRYRGKPATFDHSSAYGQFGDLMLELVVDHTVGPSAVRDVVGDGEGLHHVAWFVDDMDAWQARLTTAGWPEVMRAETRSQPFAFHDATAELGHMIELYEATPHLVAFYEHVRSLAA